LLKTQEFEVAEVGDGQLFLFVPGREEPLNALATYLSNHVIVGDALFVKREEVDLG
jgi:hypothetical protein